MDWKEEPAVEVRAVEVKLNVARQTAVVCRCPSYERGAGLRDGLERCVQGSAVSKGLRVVVGRGDEDIACARVSVCVCMHV